MNATLEAYWRGLVEEKATEAKQQYLDALKLARSLGLDYQTPSVWATASIEDVLARIETVVANGLINNAPMRRAALGAVEKPPIMLSQLYVEYKITQKLALSKMSPDQLRKWKAAKKRAVEILIERIGDKALHQLTRDNALAYSDWWEERVLTEGIGAGTANKNISHIGGMIRAVNKRLKLGLDDVFAGTRIEGGRDGQRAPFPLEFIRHVILAPGTLDELNDEARDVVYVVMETGARPSEIINLTAQCVVLDAAIPYIRIQAEGRVLKTEHSERDIPLVGLALESMMRHADGFPRYFDKGSNLSATLMKYFKKHNLPPTAKHSIYSFRHSFKDRLKAVEAPEELIDEMMGHRTDKPQYGDGYGLKLKLKYLQAIALTPAETATAVSEPA
jgi:integrase